MTVFAHNKTALMKKKLPISKKNKECATPIQLRRGSLPNIYHPSAPFFVFFEHEFPQVPFLVVFRACERHDVDYLVFLFSLAAQRRIDLKKGEKWEKLE